MSEEDRAAAGRLIENWTSALSARDARIFAERVVRRPKNKTLRELSNVFGIIGERVRQLESDITRRFHNFLLSARAAPVTRHARAVRHAAGAAVLPQELPGLLGTSPDASTARVVLAVAGPYQELDDGWHALESAVETDPTPNIEELADELGLIDRATATRLLSAWGLRPELTAAWLTRNGRIKTVKGRLALWKRGAGDRMAFALFDIGRPATIEELKKRMGGNVSYASIMTAFKKDPRVTRVEKKRYALTSWGMPAYSTIADAMINTLRNHREMPVQRLAQTMKKTYGIPVQSTLSYSAETISKVPARLPAQR